MTGKRFFRNELVKRKKEYKTGRIYLHDLKYVIQRSWWVFLITVILFLILVPFSTAGLQGDSIFNIEVTHDQLKFRLIHEQALPYVLAGAVVMGVVCAVIMFYFLHDKKETTIFLSLGMTRSGIFRNRCLAGLTMLFLGIAVPMFISMILNLKALGGYDCLIRNSLYLTGGLFITAAVSFLVASCVSFLSGTVAETIVYWAGLMASPLIICHSFNLLLKILYWGNAWGVSGYGDTEMIKESLSQKFSFLNPLEFFYTSLKTGAQFMRPLSTATPDPVNGKLLGGWTVVTVLLFLLAWFLLKKRKAESAGIAGTSRSLSEWLIGVTGFFVFSQILGFLYSYSHGIAVLFAVGGGLVTNLFWRKVLFSYRMNRVKYFVSAGVQTGVFLGISFVCFSGFFGNTARFLDNSTVEEVQISYVGAPGMLASPAEGSSTGGGYYISGMISFDDPEEIDQVREIQRQFLKEGPQDMETDSKEFENTVVPYDIVFSYIDEKGKEHVWYYDRASMKELKQLLALEDTQSRKEARRQLFSGEADVQDEIIWADAAYRNGTVYLTDRFCSSTYQLDLTDSQRKELMNAIKADVEQQDTDQLYFPEEDTYAILMFSQNGEYDCQHYAYNLDNAFVYISKKDTNMLSWLQANDLMGLVREDAAVESIVLQKFDPHMGINDLTYPMGMYFMSYRADTPDEFLIQKDFGEKYTITDTDKINAILPGLKNGYYMSGGGWLAAVKIQDVDGWIYMFLPQKNVPDFVKG